MNKHQVLILVAGIVTTGVVMVFGIAHSPPPQACPVVEVAPGQYSQNFQTTLPRWSVFTSLGLLILTGALVYRNRRQGAA